MMRGTIGGLARGAAMALGLAAAGLAPLAGAGRAADGIWIQIEARPDQPQAANRAAAWAQAFPDLSGFRMTTGWYGLALGPFSREEARARLATLRAEGRIPPDSYIAQGAGYLDRFWPGEGAPPSDPLPSGPLSSHLPPPSLPPPSLPPSSLPPSSLPPSSLPPSSLPPSSLPPSGGAPDVPTPPVVGAPTVPTPPVVGAPPVVAAPTVPAPVVLPPRIETPAEARQAEAHLSRAMRVEVQEALAWDGHPVGVADGAFGPATRAAMAAWQKDAGAEPTGILTGPQRDGLISSYRAAVERLGFRAVADGPAGITVTIPTALFEPPRYEPPFIRYAARAPGGPQLLLVSSPDPADYGTVLGRLPSLLPGAEVQRGEQALTARLTNGPWEGAAEVALRDGLLKGWILSWPAAQERQMALVADRIRASYRTVPQRALDPSHGRQTEAERAALRQGLAPNRPSRSRSGVRLGDGAVLTTAEAVTGCRAITAGGRPAGLRHSDAARGLAVLGVAGDPAPGAVFSGAAMAGPVAIAGYSTGPSMAAPAVSRGAAAPGGGGDTAALAARLFRGDEGGPVLDGSGRLLGIVLPRRPEAGREAAGLARIGPVAAAAGIAPAPGPEEAPGPALGPAALTAQARALTVRVLCWE